MWIVLTNGLGCLLKKTVWHKGKQTLYKQYISWSLIGSTDLEGDPTDFKHPYYFTSHE